MKIATSCLFAILCATLPCTASARNLWMICYGTNYTNQGITYNPRTTPLKYPIINDAQKKKTIDSVINAWGKNRPADTWGCKAFEEDIDAEWAALDRFSTYLNQHGYQAYNGPAWGGPRSY